MSARLAIAAAIAASALSASCVRPSLLTCDDGITCPNNTVCSPLGSGCVDPGLVAECDGKPDNSPCATDGSADAGRCGSGLCSDQWCGNGVIDPGESCDDGNRNPADTCDGCQPTAWTATSLLGGETQNGSALALDFPIGVAFGPDGSIYVSDASRVHRLDLTSGVVTTIVGTATAGSGGDGNVGTSVPLAFPQGLAVDGQGNVYIADTGNQQIRRLDANTQIVTTIAGTGTMGSANFVGPATLAELSQPTGIAVDGLGNVYFSDAGNFAIRRIDATTGDISTYVGGGGSGFGGDDGPATGPNVKLGFPDGLKLDHAGNLFFADTTNGRVRRVDAVTETLTTVAGNGTTTATATGSNELAIVTAIGGPVGVDVDADGNVYICDANDDFIFEVSASNKTISTIAGDGTVGFKGDGGLATTAEFAAPRGFGGDGNGHLLVADTDNSRVRELTLAPQGGSTIATVIGNGTIGTGSTNGGAATSAALDGPAGLGFDAAGDLYITDSRRVWRVDGSAGTITSIAGGGFTGAGNGGSAVTSELFSPEGVVVDGSGDVFIAEGSGSQGDDVRRIDATTGKISEFAGTGVPGSSNDNIKAINAEFDACSSVAFDGSGELVIGDFFNNRVRRIDGSGTITTIAGNGNAGYSGDDVAATSTAVGHPWGIAFDGSGNMYVGDDNNRRIRRVDFGGVGSGSASTTIETIAGTGDATFAGEGGSAVDASFSSVQGVAVDSVRGTVYIADGADNRLLEVSGGVLTSMVGDGSPDTSGDGGPFEDALTANVDGVTVDTAGNIYFSDQTNNQVRRIDIVSGEITTVAGPIDPDGTGPQIVARLADPRAIAILSPTRTLYAAGGTGTVELYDQTRQWVSAVAGRYPQSGSISTLARFRDRSFGSVGGIAYDPAGARFFITETSTNRIDVVTMGSGSTAGSGSDPSTWTISPLNIGTEGFADGPIAAARFRGPTGLFYDGSTKTLYVADTGNHAIRAIAIAQGVTSATVSTPVGIGANSGFAGDHGAADVALLDSPAAVALCNGDLFVADTGNNRVRRVHAGTITSVLGDGTPSSAGSGSPANAFPVDSPQGIACDSFGNVYVTSRESVREVVANDANAVDGSGQVLTVFGAPPRDTFPASAMQCLTGVAVVDAATLQIVDACTGLLVQLTRQTSSM